MEQVQFYRNEIENYATEATNGFYNAYVFCSCCKPIGKFQSKQNIIVKNGQIDENSVVKAANEMANHNDRNIYLERITFDGINFIFGFGS